MIDIEKITEIVPWIAAQREIMAAADRAHIAAFYASMKPADADAAWHAVNYFDHALRALEIADEALVNYSGLIVSGIDFGLAARFANAKMRHALGGNNV